eukprot:TRINITY_DN5219_c0_g1_i7.p2 TRINITY_DN5219_c0_g1~~TRINITY_DN5219_c0_g1_i7.p2  ORF type:complete len:174 (+),score=22.01 TRINITY_DN5219_c0_g1_i7:182-703(+)
MQDLLKNDLSIKSLQLARYETVFSNRIVLETGLRAKFGRDKCGRTSMTRLCDDFIKEHMFTNGKLTKKAELLLEQLGTGANPQAVQRALRKLYQLAPDAHHNLISITGHGLAIGGDEPVATAMAMTVVMLQRCCDAAFSLDVRFLDVDLQDKKLLSGGKVFPPINHVEDVNAE